MSSITMKRTASSDLIGMASDMGGMVGERITSGSWRMSEGDSSIHSSFTYKNKASYCVAVADYQTVYNEMKQADPTATPGVLRLKAMAQISKLNAKKRLDRERWLEKQCKKEQEKPPPSRAKKRIDRFVNQMSNSMTRSETSSSNSSNANMRTMTQSPDNPKAAAARPASRQPSKLSSSMRLSAVVSTSNRLSSMVSETFGSPHATGSSTVSHRSRNMSWNLSVRDLNLTEEARGREVKRYEQADASVQNEGLHQSDRDVNVGALANPSTFSDSSVQSSLTDEDDGRDDRNPEEGNGDQCIQDHEFTRLIERMLGENKMERRGGVIYRPIGKKRESSGKLHEQAPVENCDATQDEVQDPVLHDQVPKKNDEPPMICKHVHKRATIETCHTTLGDEPEAPIPIQLLQNTSSDTAIQYQNNHKRTSVVSQLTDNSDSESSEDDDGLLVGFVDRSGHLCDRYDDEELIVEFVDRSDRSSWLED